MLYLVFLAALADDGKFLLAARRCRRPTCTDYIVSLNTDDMSKGSKTYIGKLRCVQSAWSSSFWLVIYSASIGAHQHVLLSARSNFLGTKFVVYDALLPHAGNRMAKSRSTRLVGTKQVSARIPPGNYPVAHISYELNVLGAR